MVKVGISGMWVQKEQIQNNAEKYHQYLGNKSLCNTADTLLVISESKSYIIESSAPPHHYCKPCFRLLLNEKKLAEIATLREKLLSLYSRQKVTLEQTIMNLITSDNCDTKYSEIKERFEEHFSHVPFDDVISFMIVQGQVYLSGDIVSLPVPPKEEIFL